MKISTKAVEILLTESMLKEDNPLIPADVRKFFPKEGGAFKLDVPEGYTIDAYMGNGVAQNHIHSHGKKRFRIQAWLHINRVQAGDVLRFEKLDQKHYRMFKLKLNP